MTTNECAHALCARFCLPKFTEAASAPAAAAIAKIVGEASLAFTYAYGNGRQNSRLLIDFKITKGDPQCRVC